MLADADEPLTDRGILDRTHERDVEGFDSSYRVATTLGRAVEWGAPVDVAEGSPYRYRLTE